MSRRISAMKFAHRTRNLPTKPGASRHEGIRREHAGRPEQAAPLMSPELFDVLDAYSTTRT